MHNEKMPFYFGIAVGVAVISTIGFFTLLIGGSGISLKWDGASSGSAVATGSTAKAKVPQFEACLADTVAANKVEADFQEGGSIGVRGTPATFINGYLISGAYPYEQVKAVIDDALAGRESTQEYLKGDDDKITKYNVPTLKDGEPFKGKKEARVFIAEYSDFECPFCLRFEPTVEQILAEYGDRITFVYRHFPLSFHENAKPAAIAAECASLQGKFWEMHGKLFELSSKNSLNKDSYLQAASELKLK